MIRILRPDFQFDDERGRLVQLVHEGYRQINVIRSLRGVRRGGHWHEQNDEAFYLIEGLLELEAVCGRESERRVFRAGDFFMIPRRVCHSFYFLEDTTLVSMYSAGVELEDGTKDIVSKEENALESHAD